VPLDPSPSFYELTYHLEAALSLLVIVIVGMINILAWGTESCCQHLGKALIAIRELQRLFRRPSDATARQPE
jgi:hypothetical protein